jgi:hypothetical protein
MQIARKVQEQSRNPSGNVNEWLVANHLFYNHPHSKSRRAEYGRGTWEYSKPNRTIFVAHMVAVVHGMAPQEDREPAVFKGKPIGR